MRFTSGMIAAVFLSGSIVAVHPSRVSAQETASVSQFAMREELPDAPQPQAGNQPAQAAQSQGGADPPIADPPEVRPSTSKTEQEKANDQVKQEEHQRVLGVIPNFNITYLGDQTVSLTAKQKFNLAIHSAIDPVSFAIPFFVAGYGELQDDNKGFPWGFKGLGERAGAAYLDAFDGGMIGNAILPSILHQDPRYYRMGHGATTHRILYAAATSFMCKHDGTGKWEPNYSNVGGNIASGALSNLYYPSSDTGVGHAISTGFVVTAEGAIGAEFDEFWPDISRKMFHKDPTHGLDAQMKAADDTKKKIAKTQRAEGNL